MTKTTRALAAILALAAVAASACGGVSGGPKKIVFNETICANQAVVRMTLGKTYRLVVDNDILTQGQNGLTVRMPEVPLVMKGEVPKNSIVGDPFSTVVLSAPPNEEAQVDVVPNRTGTWGIQCGAIIGTRSQVFDMNLTIIPDE